MRTETRALSGDSAGTARQITCHIWGRPGAVPCVYIQAGLHADEMPGMLVAQHLMALLDIAEAAGLVTGEVRVVPAANPIGLGQWTAMKPQGRHEMESLQNFNRHFADLAALTADRLEPRLTRDEAANGAAIRAAFRAAVDALPARTDLAEQRRALMSWSVAADHVLDLHCDHHSILHFYTSPSRPEETALLARAIGAELVLMAEVSGGNAFDEAHSAPWAALRRRFGDRFPIPPGPFAATLEYRGQTDVTDDMAAQDAARLMAYLGAIGAVTGQPTPAHPDAPRRPLAGAITAYAPQGGIVVWHRQPGDVVAAGEVLADVIDPVLRARLPVTAPVDGLLYRTELWRSCLRGQGLCDVAGEAAIKTGDLLSD